MLLRFDKGTKPKLDPFCGLAWGNIQFPGVLDLSREPEISRSNFFGFESAAQTLRKKPTGYLKD